MTEPVTDILIARARRQDRLTPMVVMSLVGHAAVVTVLMLISLRAESPVPPKVFTVSVAGSGGPRSGGANAIGGRQVDRVAPEPPKAIETPAAVPPKMTLPAPEKPRPAPPRPEAERRPAEAAVTRPSPRTGDQVQAGSTQVDTGARGTGFGLSSGGGPAGVDLGVTDFCCPEYVRLMRELIDDGWRRDQGRVGMTTVRFTINRDGSITGAMVERRSGFPPLDEAALRAVQLARLPPLPTQFTDPRLIVRLTFEYER
jgi:TonB family protein